MINKHQKVSERATLLRKSEEFKHRAHREHRGASRKKENLTTETRNHRGRKNGPLISVVSCLCGKKIPLSDLGALGVLVFILPIYTTHTSRKAGHRHGHVEEELCTDLRKSSIENSDILY